LAGFRDGSPTDDNLSTFASEAKDPVEALRLTPGRASLTEIGYGSITFREACELDPTLLLPAALAGALQGRFRPGFRQRFADLATISDLFLAIENPGGDPCGETLFARFTEHLK
jgi:hypothetical protein